MTLPEPPFAPEEPRSEPPTLPVWVPFAVIFAAFALINVFGAVVFGLVAASDSKIEEFDDLPEAVKISLTFTQDVIFVYAAYLALKLGSLAPRPVLGLQRVRDTRAAIRWSVIVYVAFWVAAIALAEIFGSPDDQPLVTNIKEEDALGILIAWCLMICIAAPFVEELFFRGFMFGVFAPRLGPVWATVLVGAVFGLVHVPAEASQLVALGVLGAGLCVLRWRTQSIIPPMALHALNNSITFGVVKDLDPALFAGVVVLSVGGVTALGAALSSRAEAAA